MFIGPCIIVKVEEWKSKLSCTSACKTSTTQNQPHQISNTQRTENKTTDVVIRQHSRKLLMMGVLMSETCWALKKWNKVASDIKLVFHSSTIAKFFFIDSFKLALHVSDDSFTHLQENFGCICSFLEQCTDSAVCRRPVTHIRSVQSMSPVGSRQQSRCMYGQRAPWRWAKLSPETRRASLKESIEQIWLHLVGCWYHCTSDAPSQKLQNIFFIFVWCCNLSC